MWNVVILIFYSVLVWLILLFSAYFLIITVPIHLALLAFPIKVLFSYSLLKTVRLIYSAPFHSWFNLGNIFNSVFSKIRKL
ncbi:alginate O-acetyltransferase [Bacillus anthracis]|nr:NADH dehydrogenase subunit 5 [Bacillus anthracis str. A0248]AHK41748.1 hypothetical protein BAPAT_pXO10128 [Bacillus anthracis str. SVA11]APT29264.1 alginate O-acetyltransferase [Bacillus anthracis]ARO21761.1 alginate O-acetyltransferase [Bacillus cereus]AQM49739.1 alginate O-acetyltransferase [Bacillus anthracis]